MSKQSKLRLDLQDLQVESFDPTARGAGERGTVFGHDDTQVVACYTFDYGCNYSWGGGTCYMSCPASCNDTCPGGPAGCGPVPETEELTCMSCYWDQGAPFYYGC
ncbi:MAG TPA: hypothetical protein VHG91_17965 [Longimicrobium sp.]|nr:hypothetical protein [Longimicrobium sp.]